MPRGLPRGSFTGLGATALLLLGAYMVMQPVVPEKKPRQASAPVTSKPVSPSPPAAKPAPAPQSVDTPNLPPPPQRAVKQTLDLLALTDPVLDRMPAQGKVASNEWKHEGGELVYHPDGKPGKLAAPVAIDCQDYEIEFKAKKHSGNDRIYVVLPLGTSRILPIVLNSPGRKVLNEKQGGSWWAGTDADVHILIRVINPPGASDRIRVQQLNIKGNPLADWSGDLNSLGSASEHHPSFPKQPLPAVLVANDKYAVQTWILRVFEGEAKVLREAKPAAAPDGSWARWTGPGGVSADKSWSFSGAAARTTQRTTLWSAAEFSGDMEVEFEWFVGPKGNGGLFYHVGGSNELEALEMQLADTANAGGTWSGGLFGIQGAVKDHGKVGEWNTAKLVINGPRREHWVNGQRACSYDVDDPQFATSVLKGKLAVKPDHQRRSGRLVLQANAGEVAYRHLVVRTLTPQAPPVSATTAPALPAAMPPTPPAPVADDPVSLRLADLEAKFQAAFERDAGAAYKAQIAKLNTGYAAALDRALAEAAQAGKLDDAVTLREEKQRITDGKGLPPEDLAPLPESLKKLRTTWRGTEAGYAKQRHEKAAPLYDAYDKALDAYQIELTRQNQIDAALRVKAVRDHVQVQRDSGVGTGSSPLGSASAVGGTSPSPGQGMGAVPVAPPLAADKVLPPPVPATQEEIRKLCEWAQQKGGSVRLRIDGRDVNFGKDEALPKGRLTLVHVGVYELSFEGNGERQWFTLMGRVADLESMSFSKNPGTMPMEDLRGLTKVKALSLTPASVDDAAFAHLTALKNLHTLQVGGYGMKQFTGAGLGYINENLLELTTNSPTLTAEGLAFLPRFKKLRRLDLKNSAVTDGMLQGLAALPDLEELDLTSTKLDGSFLAYLPAKSKLKRLKLEDIKTFKPEHLKHLAKFRNLEFLGLPPIDPSPEALAVIAGLDELQDLTFINNRVFTGEGFKGLKGFKNLMYLGLHSCPVNDAALEAVSTAIPGLARFEMTNSENNKATITAEGFSRFLGRLKSLRAFNFHGERTTDEWMPAIAQVKNLDYLMLTGAKVTDQGVAQLMKLPLGYLRLDGCPLITDAVIPILKTCPTLGGVPVDNTQMTDAGKAELRRVLDANRAR